MKQHDEYARQFIQSFSLWDIIQLWADERLIHPTLVARYLCLGILQEGLSINSIEQKWRPDLVNSCFDSTPYLIFRASPQYRPIVLERSVFHHLTAIANQSDKPRQHRLASTRIERAAFQQWLMRKQQPLPTFWF